MKKSRQVPVPLRLTSRELRPLTGSSPQSQIFAALISAVFLGELPGYGALLGAPVIMLCALSLSLSLCCAPSWLPDPWGRARLTVRQTQPNCGGAGAWGLSCESGSASQARRSIIGTLCKSAPARSDRNRRFSYAYVYTTFIHACDRRGYHLLIDALRGALYNLIDALRGPLYRRPPGAPI